MSRRTRRRPAPRARRTDAGASIGKSSELRASDRGSRLLVALVVVAVSAAATAVRVLFVQSWNEQREVASAFYRGDAGAFLAFAAHLVDGRPFDSGVPFHPPGWPIVLAVFFHAMGFAPLRGQPADPAAVKTFVAAISGLSVGLSCLLANRVGGRAPMLAVAALGTFHFGHILIGTVPASEALFGLMLAIVLLLALEVTGASRRAVGLAALTGAAAAFTALVRAEFLLGALLLGIALPLIRPAAGRTRVAVVYGLAFAAVLAPTTVSNWRAISRFNEAHATRLPGPLPRFAPLTSYGPLNFATANHEHSEGIGNIDHPLLAAIEDPEEFIADGQLDLAHPAVYLMYVEGYAIGTRWIIEHPGDAVRLMLRKATITAGVFAHGYLHGNWPAGVNGTRRRVDAFDAAVRTIWPIHVGLAVVGAWLLRQDVRVWWIWGAALLTLCASALLFFGYVRLGTAYLPAIWILQGVALAALVRRLPWPAVVRARPALAVGALMLGLLAIEILAARTPRSVTLEGPRDAAGTLMEDETLTVREQ